MSKLLIVVLVLGMVFPVIGLEYAALETVDLVKTYPAEGVLVPFAQLMNPEEPFKSLQVYAVNALSEEVVTLSEDKIGTDGNAYSDSPSVSADGTKAVFHSWSTNWVPQVRGVNVYLKDLTTGELHLLQTYAKAPAISPDGTFVVYEYVGNSLEFPYLVKYTIATRQMESIAYTSLGNSAGYYCARISISGDSRFVAFHTTTPLEPTDTNWGVDIYVYDVIGKGFRRVGTAGTFPTFQGNILTSAGGASYLITDTSITPVIIPVETEPEVILVKP